ncbi:hypothetical protein CP8484711_1338 [Chlamydia psittaci 84-8471/1]|nr:hypothetical protein CP8484711_1338 [Chlamydia psittaci 84-8471/1]
MIVYSMIWHIRIFNLRKWKEIFKVVSYIFNGYFCSLNTKLISLKHLNLISFINKR